MSDEQEPDDRAEAIAWGKEKLKDAIAELADAKLIDGPAVEAGIAWMLPFKIFIAGVRETASAPVALWIIGGDVRTDHVDVRVADTPRDAARYFALSWQIAAAREGDNLRAEQAELLYSLADSDEAWV